MFDWLFDLKADALEREQAERWRRLEENFDKLIEAKIERLPPERREKYHQKLQACCRRESRGGSS